VTRTAQKLAGARTLVTGATGGLGRAIAEACAERGAALVLSGRQEAPLYELASALKAQAVVADLARRADLEALIESVGPVDVLVSNAALPAGGAVATFSIAEIDRALDVNLRAAMVLSRSLGQGMVERGHGHLVFVSSLAAAFPTPGLTVYNATKAALTSYALSLRGELRPHGVGVSVGHPGPIRAAGMWADTKLDPPRGLKTKSPGQVGSAVVQAVERDRAEINIAPVALRLGAVFGRAVPTLFARIAPRLGASEFTDAMADALRHKR